MPIKRSSAKAKGKLLEKLIKKKLLDTFPELDHTEDVRTTVGSEHGADIKLSKKAQVLIPLKIEAKARARITVYEWYAQASSHKGELEPVVIIRMDRNKPLLIVDVDYFFDLLVRSKRRSS